MCMRMTRFEYFKRRKHTEKPPHRAESGGVVAISVAGGKPPSVKADSRAVNGSREGAVGGHLLKRLRSRQVILRAKVSIPRIEDRWMNVPIQTIINIFQGRVNVRTRQPDAPRSDQGRSKVLPQSHLLVLEPHFGAYISAMGFDGVEGDGSSGTRCAGC